MPDMQETSSGISPSAVPADQSSAPEAPVNTDGANTSAESAPVEPPKDDAATEARKAFKGVQKRIDELTRARYEAEERGRQEVAQWQQRAQQLEEAIRASQANAPLPKLEQYPDIETWAAEVAKVQAEKIIAERMEAQQRQQYEAQQQYQKQVVQQQAMMRFQSELDARVKAAEKTYPGFLDKITNAELPGMVNTPAFTAAWESEHFAAIANHLAEHPEKAHQIVALSPVGQIREIARIEAAIQAGKVVSSTPAPPSTVGGVKGAGTKDPASMSYDEFVAFRRKQIAQRR